MCSGKCSKAFREIVTILCLLFFSMLESVDRDIIVYNIDGLSRMPKCIMMGVTQQRYLYNYIGESYMPMNLHKTTPK